MARTDRNDAQAIIPGAMADLAGQASADNGSVEEQLAVIIHAAREVAVAAEELLREVTQAGGLRGTPHAVSMAPRLLAATQQQLASVAAMLRKS